MQRYLQLAAIALIAIVLAPMDQLKAATYAFNANSFGPSDSGVPLDTFPAVSLAIQDSAVKSGSFSASYVGGPANFQGDYASLISFEIGSAVTVTPTTGDPSTFRANFVFNTDGSIDVGALFYMGDSYSIDIAGFDGLFQGTFAPDKTGGEGFVSGAFTVVPEPSSIALLAVGAFGLGMIRRRARASCTT